MYVWATAKKANAFKKYTNNLFKCLHFFKDTKLM